MSQEHRDVCHFIQTQKRRYQLQPNRVYTIGRNPDNNIFLSDPTVSRTHARIEWDKGAFVIHDTNSTNGILVNGIETKNARLSSTDILMIGNTELVYTVKCSDSCEETLAPDDSLLLETRIRALVQDMKDPDLKSRFDELIGLFSSKKKNLSDLAYRDTLTGLLNRRSFDDILTEEWKRRQRYKRNLSLIMVDIDHFKQVNDRYGHQRGDSVLKTVSTIIQDNVRSSDYACRYGGEEICVILPETSLQHALVTAEKLRKLIETHTREIEGFTVTASFGVASFTASMKTPQELLHKADAALYQAKKEGRNRVTG